MNMVLFWYLGTRIPKVGKKREGKGDIQAPSNLSLSSTLIQTEMLMFPSFLKLWYLLFNASIHCDYLCISVFIWESLIK